MALRKYAQMHIRSEVTATDRASAGLFETHPLAVHAPRFPAAVLHLPFSFILSHLPRTFDDQSFKRSDSDTKREPVLRLDKIVESMKPPYSWGQNMGDELPPTPAVRHSTPMQSSPGTWLRSLENRNGMEPAEIIERFWSDFPLLNEFFHRNCSSSTIVAVLSGISRLLLLITDDQVAKFSADTTGLTDAAVRNQLKELVTSWALLKRTGDDAITATSTADSNPVLVQWRRATERIYRHIVAVISSPRKSFGNGCSVVLSDSRCNGHHTSDGCFERDVRLPAALKGAKLAGAKMNGEGTQLITSVSDYYIDFVQQKVLPKAHSTPYLKRMKSRCSSARTDDEVLTLTDDSDGNGGEDTSKFRR
jgi:hypothetical protein